MQPKKLTQTLTVLLATGSIITYAAFLAVWGHTALRRKCEIDYVSRLVAAHECFEHQYRKLLHQKNNQNGIKILRALPSSGDDQCEDMLLTGRAQQSPNESLYKLPEDDWKKSADFVGQIRREWRNQSTDWVESYAQAVVGGTRKVFADHLLPFAIDSNQILDYPGLFINTDIPPDCPPGAVCSVPFDSDPEDDQKAAILTRSRSVGRIALVPDSYGKSQPQATQMQDCVTSPQGYDPTGACNPYFWGTAFVIANGVVATTCHVMDPLVKDGKLHLGGMKLIIDFGYRSDEYDNNNEWEINPDYFECSQREDLDVALLKLGKPIKGTPSYPAPLSLYIGPKEIYFGSDRDIQHHYLALIGYGDLEHFDDSITERIYRVFTKQYLKTPNLKIPTNGLSPSRYYNHDKFALLDWMVSAPECLRYTEQLFHVASTTVGASGSVLIDINDSKKKQYFGKVVAMHTCCSKYFPQSKDTAPVSDLPCARVTRTFDNQAVGIWSILQDAHLYSVLKTLDPNFPY